MMILDTGNYYTATKGKFEISSDQPQFPESNHRIGSKGFSKIKFASTSDCKIKVLQDQSNGSSRSRIEPYKLLANQSQMIDIIEPNLEWNLVFQLVELKPDFKCHVSFELIS